MTLPGRMRPPAISVYSDGVLLSDGRDTASLAPMVLTGLRVQWGRSTILDQPQPATCALTLLDALGGQGFRELVGVGRTLSVRADATIYPAPGGVVLMDYPFTAAPVPPVVVQTGTASLSAGTLKVVGGFGPQPLVLDFPPGKPEPPKGDPAAWDAIPRPAAGQSWSAAVQVVGLPAAFCGWSGWRATAYPLNYTAPWQRGTQRSDVPLLTTGVATTYVPTPDAWQGIRVILSPTGPAWNQLNTSAWSALDTRIWQDLDTFTVDNVKLLAPAAGTQRSGMVFTGRITDMAARFDESSAATLVDITAQDERAELDNRDVGDEPWLAERLDARFARIITKSGQAITYQIDATPAPLQVSWRDVDRQGALTLLQELAISGDSVLWCATSMSTGPYLALESLAQRPARSGLSQGADGVVIIGPVTSIPGQVVLDACDLSREPVRWIQDVADVSTRLAVTWREQTLDDKGQPAPTDRVASVQDNVLEQSLGTRRIAVSTQLTTANDATVLASNILGRTSTPGWRISGLTWDALDADAMSSDQLTRMMTLLDGTTRNGAPVLVTNLPPWSPVEGVTQVPLFVEGGTYTSHDGAWELDMITSAPTAAGKSCVWSDMPSTAHPVTIWAWRDFDPGIRWVDLTGTLVT
jgi:hypothetical protein